MSQRDVIVIGAGLAGLSAARILERHGLEVEVLEARNRVGGRTERGVSRTGLTLELGGQWIGPGQTRMYELVEEFGLEVVPTFNRGDALIRLGEKTTRTPAAAAAPKLSPFVLADLAQAFARFDRLSSTVPLEAPWDAPKADTFDSMTFETWIRRTLRTPTGREFFRIASEAVFAAQARDFSLLHALFYAKSGGNLQRLLDTENGAQQDRIRGGTIRFAESLAAELRRQPTLGTPVRRITWTEGGVDIDTSGTRHFARRALVTLPPTLAGRLEYAPGLPARRDQLTQRIPAGSVIKFHAIYERPWWRDKGLNGQAAGDNEYIKVVFDNSIEGEPYGVLVGFFEGDAARLASEWSPERRAEVIADELAAFFGEAAREPIEIMERDWNAEEFTRGCYGAHFAPGVWSSFGPSLREPVGPIHWAGAEYSPVWNGYMEGAVRSGEAAAQTLIAELGA